MNDIEHKYVGALDSDSFKKRFKEIHFRVNVSTEMVWSMLSQCYKCKNTFIIITIIIIIYHYLFQVIEKRRRDRINTSLSELRRLVPSAFEKQGSAKLEKAEILQMTVDHLKMLHSKGTLQLPVYSLRDIWWWCMVFWV